MESKKRLALEIGLVGVIIYLWLNRCRKNKVIAEAKAGADVAPNTTTTPAQGGECGSVSSDCMGTDTSKNSQLGKTISIADSSANFSGMKAQYFR